MAPIKFRGLFPPSKTRHVPRASLLTFVIKDLFSIPQLLCLGALSQTALLLLLPPHLALAPTLLFLLYTLASTALQSILPSHNPWLSDIMPDRATAQFPNATYDPSHPDSKPLFGSSPSSRQVVVFHIGVRYSHPLGLLAPGVLEFRARLAAQYDELALRAREYGFLGGSFWRGAERSRVNAGMAVMYFASLEGLHAFAHDEVHRGAWEWYEGFVRRTGHRHIGIFHETFVVPAERWETIYGNCPPVLMAGTSVPVVDEGNGEEEWVRPVVDGATPRLRSKYGRMGKTQGGYQLGE